MKKIIFTVFIICVLMFTFCVSAFAANERLFTSEIPDYVDFSGGAWFETFDSSLGRCTVVFPVEFKNNIFGFSLSASGLPDNIVNLSNSTVYGTVFTSNGSTYSCRANRFSEIEYQNSSSSYNSYVSLSPRADTLSNSNILFVTDDMNYVNDTVPDYNKYFLFIFSFIGFCEFLSLCSNLLRRGRR